MEVPTFVFVRSRMYMSPLQNLMISTPSLSYTMGCAEPVPTTKRSPEGLWLMHVMGYPLSGSMERKERWRLRARHMQGREPVIWWEE